MTPNENISELCAIIERLNTPNPANPAEISDASYGRVMAGLHDDTWVRSFVPGVD